MVKEARKKNEGLNIFLAQFGNPGNWSVYAVILSASNAQKNF